MIKAIFIVGAFVLALTGAAAAQESGDAAGGPYLLQPGDRIDVSVLEDPTLNRQVLILPDGRISLPIAGTLVASGRTPDRLAATIRSRLSSIFVSPPTVTVSAVGLAAPDLEAEEQEPPALVFVLGEVGNPGAIPFETPMTALQFLAMAGGPGPFAARDRIQIHHKAQEDGAEAYVEIFDYEALEDGEADAPLIELADGDVIVVPERGLFD